MFCFHVMGGGFVRLGLPFPPRPNCHLRVTDLRRTFLSPPDLDLRRLKSLCRLGRGGARCIHAWGPVWGSSASKSAWPCSCGSSTPAAAWAAAATAAPPRPRRGQRRGGCTRRARTRRSGDLVGRGRNRRASGASGMPSAHRPPLGATTNQGPKASAAAAWQVQTRLFALMPGRGDLRRVARCLLLWAWAMR
jgi:hypothetical protein